ncbi:hypothetical protein GLO73106DRAFT_00030100 [Gloeocapsa sp. PCC 73106]|nr:hypothetical protein GLO73106DRAFT_00030100 [Gloeocapsa sp. PCC 73106]
MYKYLPGLDIIILKILLIAKEKIGFFLPFILIVINAVILQN